MNNGLKEIEDRIAQYAPLKGASDKDLSFLFNNMCNDLHYLLDRVREANNKSTDLRAYGARLLEENTRLRATLEWYEEQSRMTDHPDWMNEAIDEIVQDKGQRARAALRR